MLRWTTLIAAVLAVTGCGDGHNHSHSHAPKKDPASERVFNADLLKSHVMAAKPQATKTVTETLKLAEGDTVVVTGVAPPVKVKPFNPALATFLLLDQVDMDRPDVKEEFECDDAAVCPNCKKMLDQYAVRIEIVDDKNKVLASTLEGYEGIGPGKPVTVEGVVKKDGKDKKLVRIVATKFYPG